MPSQWKNTMLMQVAWHQSPNLWPQKAFLPFWEQTQAGVIPRNHLDFGPHPPDDLSTSLWSRGCPEVCKVTVGWENYSLHSVVIVLRSNCSLFVCVCFVFFFNLILFFKLYIIVLVLPNIKMNPPQVYMCSPSWTLLPPPSPFHPSGSSQCTSPKHPVSCIEPGLATHFIHDIYMFQCHSPKSSHPLPLPQSQKTVLYICVSFAVSYTGLLLPSF